MSHKRPSVGFLFDRTNTWIRDRVERRFGADNELTRLSRFSDDPEQLTGLDVVFVLGVTKILPADYLTRNKNTLVVHSSDLPKGRGMAPLQWQVLEGKSVIPTVLLRAEAKFDTGDILGRTEIVLDGTELYPELRAKQGQAVLDLIEAYLSSYPNVTARAQSGEPTYYPARSPADSQIDPDKSLAEQFDLLRIVNNDGWPAFFVYRGRRYRLKIEPFDGD